MTKFLLAALLGVFIFSSIANANTGKIEPIRITPKQDRNIASDDDGFVPILAKPKSKAAQRRKPAAKCAGSKCSKKKTDKT